MKTDELNSDYQELFNEYSCIVKGTFTGKGFKDQREQYIQSFHARIFLLGEEVYLLINQSKYSSCQIVIRSMFETLVDLKCLVQDSEYLKVLEQDDIKTELMKLNKHSVENPFCENMTGEEKTTRIKELKEREDKRYKWLIYQKIEKSGMGEANGTFYADLCEYSHGGILSLATKVFDNGRVVFDKKIRIHDLKYFLDTTFRIMIQSSILTIAVMKLDQELIKILGNMPQKFPVLIEQN